MDIGGSGSDEQTHQTADAGVAGGGSKLPHFETIAQAFGPAHAGKVKGIDAHVGGEAANATGQLGVQAYASGNSVAFGQAPDLHSAAHEAAHVVQQRAGVVQPKLGVGQPNDEYEREADAVADRVVSGQSAADLLRHYDGKDGAAGKSVQSKAVQFLGTPLGQQLPADAVKPMYGEDHNQRRYSREQYEGLWEKEQGRKLKPHERATIERGCIGITANNLAGGGNPLQYSEGNFADFDRAHGFMDMKNQELHAMRANPATASRAPQGEYVMFAKLFWSNQKDGDNKAPDDKAFRPDDEGRIDMSSYEYKGQPGYVNFDYGFWDDSTKSFWHANHMEYKDPEKRKTNPMKVYQSTRDKFIAGYIDFDRIVFGVALAQNYDPGKAAIVHAGG
ncbi:MAG: DUF4157 domain-containing protein [Deltaproteobacteria bacterium]|nr:DUF4157 domain-containing protein [Deltaproteobacteria bacterium]